jgi:hypothetical protein
MKNLPICYYDDDVAQYCGNYGRSVHTQSARKPRFDELFCVFDHIKEKCSLLRDAQQATIRW